LRYRRYAKNPLHEKGGIINEKGGEFCTVRLRIPAGLITLDQMEGTSRLPENSTQIYI
jgi:hypothetical protein